MTDPLGSDPRRCALAEARELRFAFTFEDYDAAVRLFRDVFRLDTLMDLEEQGGRGVILKVPSATLELFDVRHTDVVDGIEAGQDRGPRRRPWPGGPRGDRSRGRGPRGAGPDPVGGPQPAVPSGRGAPAHAVRARGWLTRPEPSRHGLGVDGVRGGLVYWLPASIRRRFRLARGRVGRARKRGSPGACRRRTRSRSKGR